MKILLDPVLTATPSKCSTNIQFVTFVDYVLNKHGLTNVMFYWRRPDFLTQEEIDWYPVHPNIRYIPCKQNPVDRVQEYFQFSPELENDVNFWGGLWDYDVIVTVRTPLIPLMKIKMNSPRHYGCTWQKQVWLIEEMPLMKFKGSVPVMNEPVQETMVLSGYAAADRVWLMSYHEQNGIAEASRKYVSPSVQRNIRDKLKSVVPAVFTEFKLKSREFFQPYEQKPFTIAFVGRMEKTQAQLEEVNAAMVNSWVLKDDKVRLMACSVSKVVKSFDTGIVECIKPSREALWELLQTQVHVAVRLTKEGGFGMSLFEPLALGTPTILLGAEYVRAMYGPDYPFYISGPGQLPGMLEFMYSNYVTAYKQFAEWHQQVFVPMYKQRFETDLLYPLMVEAVKDFDTSVRARWIEAYSEKKDNDIVQLIAQHVQDKQEFVFGDVVKALGVTGDLEHLAKKMEDNWGEGKGLPWLPTWNEPRLAMKYLFGWEDASPVVGHLRKIA